MSYGDESGYGTKRNTYGDETEEGGYNKASTYDDDGESAYGQKKSGYGGEYGEDTEAAEGGYKKSGKADEYGQQTSFAYGGKKDSDGDCEEMATVVEKESTAAGREKFMEVYDQMKKEVLADSDFVTFTNEARAWVEEMFRFDVLGGMIRSDTVPGGIQGSYPTQLSAFRKVYRTKLQALNVDAVEIRILLSNYEPLCWDPLSSRKVVDSIITDVRNAYEGNYLDDPSVAAANAAMEKLIEKDGFSKSCWIPVSELRKRDEKAFMVAVNSKIKKLRGKGESLMSRSKRARKLRSLHPSNRFGDWARQTGIAEAIVALTKVKERGRPVFMPRCRPRILRVSNNWVAYVPMAGRSDEQVEVGQASIIKDSLELQPSVNSAEAGPNHGEVVVQPDLGCHPRKRKAEDEWSEDRLSAMSGALQNHLANVHHNCDLSTVHVQSGDEHGTGISWDRAGHVVTTNHVVVSDDVEVTFSSAGFQAKSYRACVVKRSEDKDLVVLKIQASEQEISWLFDTFKPVVLNEGETPRVGHEVFTVGYPYHFEKSHTHGKVQGFPLGPFHMKRDEVDLKLAGVIQISAPIYPGNSGGPLFNHAGHLIGVVFANSNIKVAVSRKRSVSMPISVGHAIPLSTVRRFVDGVIMNQH